MSLEPTGFLGGSSTPSVRPAPPSFDGQDNVPAQWEWQPSPAHLVLVLFLDIFGGRPGTHGQTRDSAAADATQHPVKQ